MNVEPSSSDCGRKKIGDCKKRRQFCDIVDSSDSAFVFDLKSGELNHQDIGQMDMYVRMMDDLKRTPGDNPTVGIILYTQMDASLPSERSGEGGAKRRSAQAKRGRLGCLLRAPEAEPLRKAWFPCWARSA
jgi:hypothetical protein